MPRPPETELAPAKVNLTLHLTGQRADGYHLLESLVVFADVGDRVTVATADDLRLSVTGPRAAGVPVDGGNLVLRAASRLRARRGVSAGAAITLDKHLPHGGGIGGGSSDAAAAIRLLARLWGVAPLTADEALALGADVPVCLTAPAPALMAGIGERLGPVPALPAGWLVLVNPGIAVPTAAVFAAHDLHHRAGGAGLEPMDDRTPLRTDTLAEWLARQRNDLTRVASAPPFAPVIADILIRLRACAGVVAADMSGSGSTCWGWFADQAPALRAVSALSQANPDWWMVAARVLRANDQLIRSTT